MEVREPKASDARRLVELAVSLIGAQRGAELVRAHAERGELLVAVRGGEVAGLLAYRSDWFGCTFVDLVIVAESARRHGVARALFEAVEQRAQGPRLFSSTEETNAASIQMHRALGFVASGHVDNLPQGYRELLFYKRLR